VKVFVDTGDFCALTIPKDEHNKKEKQTCNDHIDYHIF